MRHKRQVEPLRKRRICVVLPGYDGFYGEILKGVRRYGESRPQWRMIFRGSPDLFGPDEVFDGVLGDFANERTALILQYKGPAVQVTNFGDLPGVLRVSLDEHAAGRVAAEHFLANGHRHFAFAGYEGVQFSEQRLEGYRAALGLRLDELHIVRFAQNFRFQHNIYTTIDWIRKLPTPLALAGFLGGEIMGKPQKVIVGGWG